MRHADQPTVEVSTHVDARPEDVWPLICRIELPSATSDELSAVRWEDGADGPARAGRRFVGTNRNDHFGEWSTVSTVVECDEPRAFAWHVGDLDDPNSRWRFTLEPDAGGTRLTQWAQLGPGPSGMHSVIARYPDSEEQIVTARLEQWRTAMRATLDAVKTTAEGARGSATAG